MNIFDNILNILLPDDLTHPVFKFADWFKSQHFLGFVLALCTLGFQTQVGQAGIGAINQVQVSNHSPLPFDTVIAQPQMLFLVLDQHFNKGETNSSAIRELYWKTSRGSAICHGDWKLIITNNTGKQELFNIAADPYENNDLSREQHIRVADLLKKMEYYQQFDGEKLPSF
jgi:hypothetical protein